MLENQDFLYIPKIQFNDITEAGVMLYFGSAIITHRYCFLLANKVSGVNIDTIKGDFYDRNYVEKMLANPNDFDVVNFETNMLTHLHEFHIFPFANLTKFEVTVGFFIFGGIKMVKNTKKLTSLTVKDVKMRKAIKEFYEKYIKQ